MINTLMACIQKTEKSRKMLVRYDRLLHLYFYIVFLSCIAKLKTNAIYKINFDRNEYNTTE